uniref:Uncharacterized protein n=1 Tax=Timema shepardi TaxID=629360 RepID=A0A7R9AY75_TIMSH|nr:unnamed protein product [Timema shepardi]
MTPVLVTVDSCDVYRGPVKTSNNPLTMRQLTQLFVLIVVVLAEGSTHPVCSLLTCQCSDHLTQLTCRGAGFESVPAGLPNTLVKLAEDGEFEYSVNNGVDLQTGPVLAEPEKNLVDIDDRVDRRKMIVDVVEDESSLLSALRSKSQL